LIRRDDLAGDQRHVFGLEVQILERAQADGFDLVEPLLIVGVEFALVQQDAFEDAGFLGQFAQVPQVLAGVN
jgi:hypothetical protein